MEAPPPRISKCFQCLDRKPNSQRSLAIELDVAPIKEERIAKVGERKTTPRRPVKGLLHFQRGPRPPVLHSGKEQGDRLVPVSLAKHSGPRGAVKDSGAGCDVDKRVPVRVAMSDQRR